MILNEIILVPLAQTPGIDDALDDPETNKYLNSCFSDYLRGKFGDITPEEAEENKRSLIPEVRTGHLKGLYPPKYKLRGPVLIETWFCPVVPVDADLEHNRTLVMYEDERGDYV